MESACEAIGAIHSFFSVLLLQISILKTKRVGDLLEKAVNTFAPTLAMLAESREEDVDTVVAKAQEIVNAAADGRGDGEKAPCMYSCCLGMPMPVLTLLFPLVEPDSAGPAEDGTEDEVVSKEPPQLTPASVVPLQFARLRKYNTFTKLPMAPFDNTADILQKYHLTNDTDVSAATALSLLHIPLLMETCPSVNARMHPAWRRVSLLRP